MKRQGVSQYKQPHVLLARGLELMQELFPGHKDQLIKAGALETDLLRDIIIVRHLLQLQQIDPAVYATATHAPLGIHVHKST